MGSLGGPSIVTSGLSIHLDAGNIKSYPGVETVNLTASGGLIGMSGITLTLISNDGVWKKYSMAGTFTGGTYPYIMYLTSVSFTGGLSYSTKCTIRTNVPSKFNYFGTQGINYVNQPMTNNGVRSSVTNSDGSFTVSNVGFIYTSTTTQTGYLLTNPIDGTVFSASTDFVWIKDLQIEQKSYTTPFINGTRGTTVATRGGWSDRSGNVNHGQMSNVPTYSSLKGGSIVFDGISNYVAISKNLDITTAFTIEYALSIRQLPTTGQYFYNFANTAGYQNNGIYGEFGVGYFALCIINTIGSAAAVYIFDHVINKPYHVTVTYENRTLKGYVDGVLRNTAALAFDPTNNTSGTTKLGAGFSYSPINMYLFRNYSRALSATEVLQNYNATKSRFI
jgi:hypothetical protein